MSYRQLPQFDDVLKGVAPSPYTLDSFKTYLARNHCSEFLEFIMDIRDYSEKYLSACCQDGHSFSQCNEDPKLLLALWQRIISIYIQPGASREMNLSDEERDQLLQYADVEVPPSPQSIEDAVKSIHDSFQASIFMSFLNSPSPPADVLLTDALPLKAARRISAGHASSSRAALGPYVNNPLSGYSTEDFVRSGADMDWQMIISHSKSAELIRPTSSLIQVDLPPPVQTRLKVRKRWRSGWKLVVKKVLQF